MGKSNAQATIESAIIGGLSERANITRASSGYAHIQLPDIMDRLFAPGLRWAIEDYLRELDAERRSVV